MDECGTNGTAPWREPFRRGPSYSPTGEIRERSNGQFVDLRDANPALWKTAADDWVSLALEAEEAANNIYDGRSSTTARGHREPLSVMLRGRPVPYWADAISSVDAHDSIGGWRVNDRHLGGPVPVPVGWFGIRGADIHASGCGGDEQ